MIKISKKVEYALIVLRHIASKAPNELTSAREISLRFQTPFDTTAKVMASLASESILHSNHGPHGGYALKRQLDRLSMFELSEIVDPRLSQDPCSTRKGACDLSHICNIIAPLNQLHSKLNDFFSKMTLAEIFSTEQA